MNLKDLRVKLFADGASLPEIEKACANPHISGFTTNPTLMRASWVKDYAEFAHVALSIIGDRPISFEVLADDFETMGRQALKIAGWGDNVYVKIPITNTKGEPSLPLIRQLSNSGVKVNVTAVMTSKQIIETAAILDTATDSIISVFAGRIADAGYNPAPLVNRAVYCSRLHTQVLWASSRELLNILQADSAGCDIITLPEALIAKLNLLGQSLEERSTDTVRMFHEDAVKSGYTL